MSLASTGPLCARSDLELIISQEKLARFNGSLIEAPIHWHRDGVFMVLQAVDGRVVGVAIRDPERL